MTELAVMESTNILALTPRDPKSGTESVSREDFYGGNSVVVVVVVYPYGHRLPPRARSRRSSDKA